MAELTRAEEIEAQQYLETLLGLRGDYKGKYQWQKDLDRNAMYGMAKVKAYSLARNEEKLEGALSGLPYQGRYTISDVADIQRGLLEKYPGAPIPSLDKYGGANAAYIAMMKYSPETLDQKELFSFWKQSPDWIDPAEISEWDNPDVGPENVQSFDDTGIPLNPMDTTYEYTPFESYLDSQLQTEYGDSLYTTGYDYELEDKTIKNLGYTPRYGANAMLRLDAKNAFIQLQQKFFDLHGKNFELASAYRSTDHDAAVGGKDRNHPKGDAFDVKFSLLNNTEQEDLKRLGSEIGLNWADYPGSSHFAWSKPALQHK